MMGDRILLERTGRVLTITNNDPATRNAIAPEFYVPMAEAVEQAATDDSLRAIVLTGAGDFFCSGGNLHGLKERSEASLEQRYSSVTKLHAMIEAMRACPKPIIAAIEGGAAGAGVPLALACDMIVAARGVYVSIAYVRIGLTPDGGTTALFGPAIPRQLLTEMIMTGDRIGVERMHELGVVNALTEKGAALAAAQELAARIAAAPPQAIANGKRLIRLSEANSFKQQLDAEADGIANALGGEEAREGIAAFLEKRAPDWG
jgi:enoyl-CoA hydratase/carnithine racemase